MFKDVFVLRKNAWHAKLMKEIWGFRTSDFTHMCPYFWLTLLNVIVFPFFFIKKSLIIILSKMITWLTDFIDNKLEQLEEKKIEKLRSDPFFAGKLINADFSKNCGKIYGKILNRLHIEDYEQFHRFVNLRRLRQEEIIQEECAKIRELKNILAEKTAIEEEKKRKRKEKITKLTVFFQPILKVFLYLVAIVSIIILIYGLYHLFLKLTSIKINYLLIFQLVKVAFLVVSIIGGIILIAYLISKLFCNDVIRCKISSFFNKIFNNVSWVFIKADKVTKPIGTFIGFIIQMLKNQCPAIKWEDK